MLQGLLGQLPECFNGRYLGATTRCPVQTIDTDHIRARVGSAARTERVPSATAWYLGGVLVRAHRPLGHPRGKLPTVGVGAQTVTSRSPDTLCV